MSSESTAAHHRSAVSASFRDPAGFVFLDDQGRLCRQINLSERDNYDRLIQSGLYDRLVADRLLVRHVEDAAIPAPTASAYKIVRPERVRFISYPYEWCFSQLKSAALLTLQIQKLALSHDMSLKDASAYNVQFDPEPTFIDTLSFEPYRPGEGWIAYRQFCQHFLAPLALMQYCDARLGQLCRVFLDGVPLDLASALLPRTTWLRPALLAHLHVHARAQRRFASTPTAAKARSVTVSRAGFSGLLDNLEAITAKLSWDPHTTQWADYYSATNYNDTAAGDKERLVGEFLDQVAPAVVWDLGANTGRYSRISASRGAFTVAFDVDPGAVERHYRASRDRHETHVLPLVLDLTNPSPAIGWANAERVEVSRRGAPDAILALALIHHLAIGNNVPLGKVAEFLATLAKWLIIEFVPKNDSQVERMLATRQDVFPDYNQPLFETAFREQFEIARSEPIAGSTRVLFLMRRRGDAS